MVLGLATYDEMIDNYSMVRISHGFHGRTKRFLFSLSRFLPMAILLPSHLFHSADYFPQSAHITVQACVNLFTHPLGAMFHCPSPMPRAHRRLAAGSRPCSTMRHSITAKKNTQPCASLPHSLWQRRFRPGALTSGACWRGAHNPTMHLSDYTHLRARLPPNAALPRRIHTTHSRMSCYGARAQR